MATLQDVHPIVSELTAKLRLPQPQIVVGPPKVPLVTPPAFLGPDGLRISPDVLDRLSVSQLKICLAYALVSSKVSKRYSQIVAALSLAVILPFGTIYTMSTAEGASGLPGWYWPAAIVAFIAYLGAGQIVAHGVDRQKDAEVFRITNDLPGIREYLLAGGYYKKGDVPVVSKPGSVEKRIANLQS